jgi:hypothetical protein
VNEKEHKLLLLLILLVVKEEMDRYQRVEKPKAETAINENEIRITTQGRMRNYITYATTLLQVLLLSLSLSLIISFSFFD